MYATLQIFCETGPDCVFVTYIDREDLFEDGLPVVNGRSGRHDPNDIWSKLPISTFLSLKILEPMRCMSYFPVVIRVKHLKGLRAYIEKIHGKSFNEVFFEVISAQPYCQFCIMVRILTSNLAHIVKMMLFLLSFDVDASAISTNSLLPFLGIQFIMHAFPR